MASMSPQDRAQITFRSETQLSLFLFKEEIVSRKNLRICQFEHNLQHVPKMISSSAFSFGDLEA